MAVSWLGKIGGKDADSLEVSSGFDAEKNCNCSDWNKLQLNEYETDPYILKLSRQLT